MEFEIDSALVQRIVADEYQQSQAEIAELGAVRAYRISLQRHDERLANASDAPTLACKAGCFWCCYFSVDVRPVEVFSILEFMDAHLQHAEKERVLLEIEANSALLKGMSEVERARRNVKCPFLAAGRCTIYEARPQTCRNYHATNASGCQKSYDEPENLDIDPDFAPLTYQIGGAHVDAFSKAMQDAGYDIEAYELNSALQTALTNPQLYHRRFEATQKVFDELESTEIPFEFMEDR
jgi:Fe-S-cluster containining protein